MATFYRFSLKDGLTIYLDVERIVIVKEAEYGCSEVHTLDNRVFLLKGLPGFIMDRLCKRPPVPHGDEGEELAALREKVRALEAVPDGFRDQHRRTEALKKARIFELRLLEQAARQSYKIWGAGDIKAYLERRIAEIERGGF